jgi:hypothetical protein
MTQMVTFKPSVLVGASITRQGNVRYEREDLGTETPDGIEIKSWKTTKTTEMLDEYKRSEAVASECRRMLRAACYPTAVGLICPMDQRDRLDAAIAAIKDKIRQANGEFQLARLGCTFVQATIATDDQEAATAIARELSGFMQELTAALESCDVKKIRGTVASMKGIEQLLPGTASQTLQTAIQTARRAASTIAREVERKGRAIDEVRREIDLAPIDVARILFVEVEEIQVPAPTADPEATERMEAIEQTEEAGAAS